MKKFSSMSDTVKAAWIVGICTIIGAVIGGIFLLRSTSANQPASTAIASVTSTTTLPATVTNSVTLTPTSTPKPTPQNLYNLATSKQPILNDPLNTNDSDNWDEGAGCSFTSGSYQVSASSGVVPCAAQSTNFSNFAYEIQMTFIQNESSQDGIFFRADSTKCKLYYFFITPVGNYGFYKSEKCGSGVQDQSLLPGNSLPFSERIKTGLNQSNLLTVVVQARTIYLYVNKFYLAQASDPDYSSGEIGIFASTNNQGFTDVAFRNAKVWQL